MNVPSKNGKHEKAAFLQSDKKNLYLSADNSSDLSLSNKFAISMNLSQEDCGNIFINNDITNEFTNTYAYGSNVFYSYHILYYADTVKVFGSSTTLYCDTYTFSGVYSSSTTISSNTVAGNFSVANILGVPSVAFYELTDLKFSYYNGTTWVTSTVDSTGDVGKKPSLCEVDGYPAISYNDVTNSKIKYAKYDGKFWQIMTLSESVSTLGSSLCVVDGSPSIAYYNGTQIRFAKYTSSWAVSTVATTALYESLYLLENNRYPSIAFQSLSNGIFYCYVYDGSSWRGPKFIHSSSVATDSIRTAVIDGKIAFCFCPYVSVSNTHESVNLSVYSEVNGAFDSRLLVNYLELNSPCSVLGIFQERKKVYFMGQISSSAETRTFLSYIKDFSEITDVDKSATVTSRSAIMFQNNPAIVYSSSANNVIFQYSDGNSFITETVTTNGTNVSACSFLGNPAISYYSTLSSDYGLKFARRVGGSWVIENVASGSNVGIVNSVASISGLISIAYQIPGSGVYFIKRTSLNVWTTPMLVEAGTTGQTISLAEVNTSGLGIIPQIAYFDQTNNRVKRAYYDGASFIVDIVDNVIAGSDKLSIIQIIDDSNTISPAVAYHSGGTLYYAIYNGSSWVRTVVSSAPSFIYSICLNNLIIDGTKTRPAITYTSQNFSLDLSKIRVAILNSNWNIYVVNSQSYNLATTVSRTDRLSLFFHKSSGGTLSYQEMSFFPTSRSVKIEPALVGVSSVSSADVSGEPAIAYQDSTNSDLKYAILSGSTWTIQTVYSTGVTGIKPSIAYDGVTLGIAFVDQTSSKIKYTYLNGGSWSVPVDVASYSSSGRVSLVYLNSNPAVVFENSGEIRCAIYNGSVWGNSLVSSSTALRGVSAVVQNSYIFVSYIDPSGYLKCATYNGSSWTSAAVDSQAATNKFPSIALIDGKPAIAYSTDLLIKYAYFDGSVWTVERVSSGTATSSVCLAEYQKKPVISLDDSGDNSNLFMYSGETWSIFSIDKFTGLQYSSVVNCGDKLHVFGASSSTSYSLMHNAINFYPSSKTTTILSKSGSYEILYQEPNDRKLIFNLTQSDTNVKSLSIRLPNNKYNHIAVVGDGSNISVYLNGGVVDSVVYSGSIASSVSPLTVGNSNMFCSFDIDDLGIWNHSSLFSQSTISQFISYLYNGGTTRRFEDLRAHWEVPAVIDYVSGKITGLNPSIASVNGQHAIAYSVISGSSQYLKYAVNSGSSWTTEIVDNSVITTGINCSLVDVSANPWITYYDQTNNVLKSARKSGGSWTISTIDGTPGISYVGLYSSTTVFDSIPVVAYYDVANAKLKFASWNGSTWFVYGGTIDSSTNDVGSYCSIAQINGTTIGVAYHDASAKGTSGGCLKYVERISGVWQTPVIVDDGTNGGGSSSDIVGTYASLSVIGGEPAIAYYDSTNYRVKYVQRSGASWVGASGTGTGDTVDTGYVGQYCSLTVISGLPIIVYYDSVNRDIKYMRYNGTIWNVEKFYETNDRGKYCSVANVGGRPQIAYFDATSGSLVFVGATAHVFNF